MSTIIDAKWRERYWKAVDRAAEWERRARESERRERVLHDAIRWHEQSRGTAAGAVDHELYRTAEANL